MAENGKEGDIHPDDDSPRNIAVNTPPADAANPGRNGGSGVGDGIFSGKYKMKKYKGMAVIINIEDFDLFRTRRESIIDYKELSTMVGNFREFREYKQKPKLTRDEIMKFLKALSKDDSLNNCDFLMCFILSYGDQGYVYGYDDKLEIDEIVKPFKGDQCKSLLDKPKLFFIQTCPPRKKNEHDDIGDDSSEDKKVEDKGHKIPVEADILVVQSCIPGHHGWEEEEPKPSWFVEALTETFTGSQSDEEDVLSLLTKVNRKLAKKIHDHKFQPKLRPRLPYTCSSLRKDVCLQL